MMNPRFFCPDGLLPDSDMPLPGPVAHHAERVLRLAVGDAVTLFDGQGGECAATLLALGKQPVARLGPRLAAERESPLQITLVQALASGDKMDWVVQKAVELGAVAIQPVAAERSVLKLAGDRADKRVAHWQQIAVAACEQSGRNRVPQVADPAAGKVSGPGLRWHPADPRARGRRGAGRQGAAERPAGGADRPRGRLVASRARPGRARRLRAAGPRAAGAAHRNRRAGRAGGPADLWGDFSGDVDV
jgi:16S rRNA (uracil1498-N3)-methyltransferase